MRSREEIRSSVWIAILAFVLLALGISLAGKLYYERDLIQFRNESFQELSTIADLKVHQIITWRHERMGDVTTISSYPGIARQVHHLFYGPTDLKGIKELRKWFEALREHYQYQTIFLLDSKGKVRLQQGDSNEMIGKSAQILAAEALRANKPMVSDLKMESGSRIIHLDYLAPLFVPEEKNPVGVIVLRIDPRQYFYPLIQEWPTPSASGEILLVRREGDQVLFLNELRHRKHTALSFRLPLADPDFLAAKAIRGEKGVVEGRDYRSKQVIGALRSVPETPWRLVAMVDTEEIFKPIRERALEIILLSLGLIATAGTTIAFFWRREQIKFYRRQHQDELERLALLKRNEYLTRYANDIILLLDHQGKIIDANDRAQAVYGYSREELLQLHQRDLNAEHASFDRYSPDETEVQEKGLLFEAIHRRKNGTTFPIEVSARWFEIEGQRLFQWIARDISERKYAEETVRASEEYLSTTLNSIGDGVITTDLARHIVRMNPVAEMLTGWSQEEARGKQLAYVFCISNEDNSEPLSCPAERAIRENDIVDLSDHTILMARDGKKRAIADSAAPIKDASGAVKGAVLVFRDVSEERATRDALAQANSAKDLFFNTVSHELRTPLSAIMNAVTIMKQPNASSTQREHAHEVIERNVYHQVRLIDDLLDQSRNMRGMMKIERKHIDLYDVIASQSDTLSAESRLKGLTVTVDCERPLSVYGDRGRLEQVIANLLGNAIKFTQTGGQITLRGSIESNEVVLSIRDNGIGIPPAFFPYLFEPFRRAENPANARIKGLGLGLAISRSLIERHGGTLTASSDGSGQGSEFSVRLPLATVISASAEAPSDQTPPHQVRRVLIVEDDRDVRETLFTLLKNMGHKVVLAETGNQALEVAKKEPLEIAFIDIGLPDISGYAVAKQLREIPSLKRVRLVALTGYTAGHDHEEALSSGFDEFLSKPVDLETLRSALARKPN